jgi:hypothetical protein
MKEALAAISLLVLTLYSNAFGQGNKYGGARLVNLPEYVLSDADMAASIDGPMSIMVKVDKTGKINDARIWSGP